ncbi:MAG: methyltransferase domain-containing protein [Deltaproteobacteria bacterium]|nr:methyltransferase domain-containing protein [Deltaproteobacteria bacterium]
MIIFLKMGTADKVKWDARYEGKKAPGEPADFLQMIFSGSSWVIPPGRSLDVATGRGRNALFLARMGFTVDAIDISTEGLRQGKARATVMGLSLNWIEADLARFPFPDSAYGLILNVNFLDRLLIPQIKKALEPGGYVIFDTYLIDQQNLGHPRNPAFLLQHNELLTLFKDYRILCYREGKFSDSGKESFRAQLLGQKPV